MKRKRDGFVPLGDVRRRYRYGRVARRLPPPPPPAGAASIHPHPLSRVFWAGTTSVGGLRTRIHHVPRLQEKPALGERSTSRSLR